MCLPAFLYHGRILILDVIFIFWYLLDTKSIKKFYVKSILTFCDHVWLFLVCIVPVAFVYVMVSILPHFLLSKFRIHMSRLISSDLVVLMI